jgi:hypothetical protein
MVHMAPIHQLLACGSIRLPMVPMSPIQCRLSCGRHAVHATTIWHTALIWPCMVHEAPIRHMRLPSGACSSKYGGNHLPYGSTWLPNGAHSSHTAQMAPQWPPCSACSSHKGAIHLCTQSPYGPLCCMWLPNGSCGSHLVLAAPTCLPYGSITGGSHTAHTTPIWPPFGSHAAPIW